MKQLVEQKQTAIEKIPYEIPDYEIRNGVSYLKTEGGKVALQVFGDHNLMNLTAARKVCEKLGISVSVFEEAIATFKGAARRLELLGKTENSAVFKDFAHSPSKLKATIHAVKQQFPDRDLIAAIELHTFSSLNADFLKEYMGTMDEADEPIVIIDTLTFKQKQMVPFEEIVVKKSFGNEKLKFFDNFEIFETYLSSIPYCDKTFLLMSSGNFGGLDLEKLKNKLLNL